jgi:hypothetical protein
MDWLMTNNSPCEAIKAINEQASLPGPFQGLPFLPRFIFESRGVEGQPRDGQTSCHHEDYPIDMGYDFLAP